MFMLQPKKTGMHFFDKNRTVAGGGLRGLCFYPFYSFFIEKECITVHNHEIV